LFEYNDFLSENSTVETDTINKRIITWYRKWYCDEISNFYEFKDKGFKFIGTEYLDKDTIGKSSDYECVKILKMIQKGKLKLIKKTICPEGTMRPYYYDFKK
jgi:hypothetical protein